MTVPCRWPRYFRPAEREVGTVLGDLDGDGDLDWVISSYGGQQWHVFVNDGAGNFTPDSDVDAEPNANPSCAIMLDVDNDGDLDLALTDEISDHTRILQNSGGPAPDCPPAPDTCRATGGGASSVLFKQQSTPDKNRMSWKWGNGNTSKAEFGDPLNTDGYTLCVYDAGVLVSTSRVTGSCMSRPCWTETPTGFTFNNKSLQPSGVQSLKLVGGTAGKAIELFKGKGASLTLPDPSSFTGPIDVQLRTTASPLCWGSRFSAPFLKDANGQLKDKSD